MIPLFSSTTWDLFVGIFQFWITRPSKFSSMGFPSLFWKFSPPTFAFFLVGKIHMYKPKMTFKSVKKDTLFLKKRCYLLVYEMFFSSLISNWPRFHGLYSVLQLNLSSYSPLSVYCLLYTNFRFLSFPQLILSRHQTVRKKLHKHLDSISHPNLYHEKLTYIKESLNGTGFSVTVSTYATMIIIKLLFSDKCRHII